MDRRNIHIRAWRAVDAVMAGTAHYDRERVLPRLLPLARSEIASGGQDMQRAIVRRLARAIRAERSRGRAGHWSYDLNRHIGLMQAHRQEIRRLVTPGR